MSTWKTWSLENPRSGAGPRSSRNTCNGWWGVTTADVTAMAIAIAMMMAAGVVSAGETAGSATAEDAPDNAADDAAVPAAAAEDGRTLRGDQEGSVLSSLTVEGENRVQIEFERPDLELDLDPGQAPGLTLDTILQVLNREEIDLTAPLIRQSVREPSPYLARAWLDGFKSGPVARFRPAVEGVDRWRLVVADSRGETVATFEGDGKPPAEIAWDGRKQDGAPALPGLTYSYVFEAFDRAGNKRNFVGEGFQIGAYRIERPAGIDLVFPGSVLNKVTVSGGRQTTLPPALVLEAASRLNQLESGVEPIRIRVTARNFEQAQGMAETVRAWLAPHVLGDPLRLQTITDVQPDAPRTGVVWISLTVL